MGAERPLTETPHGTVGLTGASDNRLRQPLRLALPAALDAGSLGDWVGVVAPWLAGPEGRATVAAVDQRVAAGATVYPAAPLRALALTPLAQLRVVVLGQDPYHGPGQAEGLAFSVPAGIPAPPSLRNIGVELVRDLGATAATPAARLGSLVAWAEQGVLLLNTSLTVENGQPGSHSKLGWHSLTAAVLRAVINDPQPKALLLWGGHAQATVLPLLAPAGKGHPHRVLMANHPSPLSARRPPLPFIGCGHFSAANAFLASQGRAPVQWLDGQRGVL